MPYFATKLASVRLNRVYDQVRSGEITPAQGRALIEKAVAAERKGLLTGMTALNKASDAGKNNPGKSLDKGSNGDKKEVTHNDPI